MKRLSVVLHAVVLLVATLQALILIYWCEFLFSLGSCHPHDLALNAIGIPMLAWVLWGKAKELGWIGPNLTQAVIARKESRFTPTSKPI